MKKIVASTGMIALSVAGMQAQDASKSWSVNGGVRGFYDSNSTLVGNGVELDSFGLGIEAGVGYNLPLDQTFLGADYTYGLKWYEGRETGETDQTHRFNLKLDHTFSEQYKVTLKDSFVVTDEPTVLDQGGTVTARTLATAMRNRANVDFAAQFSPKLGATIGYGNTYYNYEEEFSDSTPFTSRSQLLDRMEHAIPIEGRYTVSPETIALAGYQYGMYDYLSNDAYDSGLPGVSPTPVSPSWRDNSSHYLYGGVEHNFSPKLNGSLRGGVQFIKYNDLPSGALVDDSSSNPYIDANLSYLYNPGSYLVLGYRHSMNATDLTVLNAESDVVFLSWTHKITSSLNANLNYQWQYSTFQQGYSGGLDNQKEMFNIFGFNLSHTINQFLTAEVGYNYDDLDSDVAGRSYSRHVAYVGLRATY